MAGKTTRNYVKIRNEYPHADISRTEIRSVSAEIPALSTYVRSALKMFLQRIVHRCRSALLTPSSSPVFTPWLQAMMQFLTITTSFQRIEMLLSCAICWLLFATSFCVLVNLEPAGLCILNFNTMYRTDFAPDFAFTIVLTFSLCCHIVAVSAFISSSPLFRSALISLTLSPVHYHLPDTAQYSGAYLPRAFLCGHHLVPVAPEKAGHHYRRSSGVDHAH